jgi:hypothetical protein
MSSELRKLWKRPELPPKTLPTRQFAAVASLHHADWGVRTGTPSAGSPAAFRGSSDLPADAGHRRVEVTEAELQPMIDLLVQRHPPGSEWRWGFNWLPGEPRRARVDSEEGVDLDAVLAEVRRGADS